MDIVIILRQRWIPALGLGLLLSVAFVMFFMSKSPLYQAEASMIVEFNTDQIVNVQEVVDTGVNNSNLFASVMNTHIERLKSRSMALLVIESLSTQEQAALGIIAATPEQSDQAATDAANRTDLVISSIIDSMLNIDWQSDSQVIRVSVKHGNPGLARTLANHYVQTYIRLQLDNRSQSTGHAVTFLDEQTIELKQQLEAEEQKLQDYRTANNLVTIEQNQQIITERLSQLSTAITTTRVRLLGIDSRAQQINEAEESIELLMNIPFVGGRESIQKIYTKLTDLKQQQSVLSERYLERHPRMMELVASIESTEASLQQAIEQAKQEILIEQKTAIAELTSLQQELAATEDEALDLEKLSIDYRVLSRKVEAQRKTFDMVTSRFNETNIAQQMSLTSIRMMDLAAIPRFPVSPNVKKIGLAGGLLFCMVFVGLPLAMEFLDNRLKTFADIERYIGKPVIGDIKLHKGKTDNDMANLALNEDYQFSEPFDTIYGALRLQMGQFNTPLSFVITSSIPSEGKTVVATNLAETLAKHQFKTIIVDCDLRRPSVHRYLDLKNNNGLLHWLRGNTPLADDPLIDEALGIRQLKAGSNVYALPAGGSTKQAGPVFEEPKFDQLVSKLKQHFDIIIFDTPPVGLFHDATLVANYADHTIFVARQNATSRQKVRHSITQMDRSESPVLGVVFNGVKNHNLATGYGYNSTDYGNGYSYSDRYSYGNSKAAKKYHAAYSEAE